MKNMATELCIILIGYFTLVPAIQVKTGFSPKTWALCCITIPISCIWCLCFVGILPFCSRWAGVWLFPADVLFHHSAFHRHPTHGGKLCEYRSRQRLYRGREPTRIHHTAFRLALSIQYTMKKKKSLSRNLPRSSQLADLNRRLPAEAGLPPPKPGPLRAREVPPPSRPSPHTITLQTPPMRSFPRLPKRLRVVYFLARTRLAQRIIMVRFRNPSALLQ